MGHPVGKRIDCRIGHQVKAVQKQTMQCELIPSAMSSLYLSVDYEMPLNIVFISGIWTFILLAA